MDGAILVLAATDGPMPPNAKTGGLVWSGVGVLVLVGLRPAGRSFDLEVK